MRIFFILPFLLMAATSPAWFAIARVGLAPIAEPAPPALPAPSDKPFAGTIELAVNASDTDHQVFSVHETIPIQAPGDTVLLYPQWETASHAPTAGVAELAGLTVSVDGALLDWVRDPVDMHAFHVQVPKGARSMALDFQFLPAATAALLRPDMVVVPRQRVLLYPSGWYVRRIRVAATLVLPHGLRAFTSLTFHRGDDGTIRFEAVTLDQLVDAPVYAGRYTRQIRLDERVAKPLRLDVLADAADDLAITPDEIGRIKEPAICLA
jgi:predicted metalloprotease with PDZ domain